jgi:uncharacterized protein YabN with tetrapyrrole methylase and pyrophosphatase domain
MEDLMENSGVKFKDMNQKQMDVFWDKAKMMEKKGEL